MDGGDLIGRTMSVLLQYSRRNGAPIAGKVVKVLVEVGATVAAGQGVIVLEAMKMENELTAERGGTVAKIHKAAGEPVDSGELLVTLA